MTFAFVSDKEYYESKRDGDKLARVHDRCRQDHPDVKLVWATRTRHIQPGFDKMFVDPRLQGRKMPKEIVDYPCEKDFTLENWFRNE